MMRFRYFSNSYFSSILFLILTGLVFIAAIPQQNATRGSSRLRLLNADFSRGVIQNGQALRILEGHVHAIQDSLELFCERAVYYDSKGKITLTGKVRLIQGKDTLLARRVNYFENSKIAIAEGNVQVYRPHQFLKSDYLEYHSDTDQIRANGHLLLHDAKERVFITGAKGEYLPQNDFSYVEENAHLWRIDSASTDTFHIFSHRMEYMFGKKKAVATDSVRIRQEALLATCDSATYLVDEEIAYLNINPHAIQDNSEMFGREMQLVMKNLELEKIMVEGSARAISVEDSALEKENRLEGREIIMFIANQELKELWAISNAKSLYNLKEDNEYRGVNAASADTIKAYFAKNELDSIRVIGGSQGVYYPEDYKGPVIQE